MRLNVFMEVSWVARWRLLNMTNLNKQGAISPAGSLAFIYQFMAKISAASVASHIGWQRINSTTITNKSNSANALTEENLFYDIYRQLVAGTSFQFTFFY